MAAGTKLAGQADHDEDGHSIGDDEGKQSAAGSRADLPGWGYSSSPSDEGEDLLDEVNEDAYRHELSTWNMSSCCTHVLLLRFAARLQDLHLMRCACRFCKFQGLALTILQQGGVPTSSELWVT